MTTNLHDKMLAAIDAYFSASDGTEAEVAENLLLDVRDEINKQQSKTQPAPVQEPVAHQNWCASLTQLLLSHPPQPAPCNCKQPAQPVPVKTYSDGKPWPVAPKPWVGLTDEELQTTWDSVMDGAVFTRREVYKAIEAKLKEKNT
jgi:hypothetical protein